MFLMQIWFWLSFRNNKFSQIKIVDKIQKGFMLKDRLLRPSLVGVAKKTTPKDKKTSENKQNLEDK